MNSKLNVKSMVLSALLCAIGIVIPMFSPLKIVFEPASFTLASHVAIFMAMFISPGTALFVSIGSTIGFFLGGFPLVVVLRALSHVVFTYLGALYLKKCPNALNNFGSSTGFSILTGLIHGICEVLIVLPFYMGANLSQGYYDKGFFMSIIGLVGIGTVIHNIIDFSISVVIWKSIPKPLISRVSPGVSANIQ